MKLSSKMYFDWLKKYHTFDLDCPFSVSENDIKIGKKTITFLEDVSEELSTKYNSFDAYALTYRRLGPRKVIELNLQNGRQCLTFGFHLAFVNFGDLFILMFNTTLADTGESLDELDVCLTPMQKQELRKLFDETVEYISEMPEYRLHFATGDITIDEKEIVWIWDT